MGEFLDGFGEVGGRDGGGGVAFQGGGVGDRGGREEGETEAEGRRGEDGQRFDEDVGYCLWVDEVRVELVSARAIQYQ